MIRTLLWLCALLCAPAAFAQHAPIANAYLISETSAIEAGKPFRVAVQLVPQEGWHTYWKNPGDAGLETSLNWHLTEGMTAGEIDWPPPTRYTEGNPDNPLVVFGYSGTVLLPVTITPPATLTNKDYTLKVTASWLICKDICIPESADVTLTLPVGTAQPSEYAGLFAAHDANHPTVIHEPQSYRSEGNHYIFSLPLSLLSTQNVASAYVIPRTTNLIRYSSAFSHEIAGDKLLVRHERTDQPYDGKVSALVDVMTDNGREVFDVEFSAIVAKPAPTEPVAQEAPFLPALIGFALLGGLILNLMPCVLPVLSLKALSLVKKSASERRHARRHGIAYTAGILLSFALFAGALLIIKDTGENIGWGYQMQSPIFVGMLVYLLFMVGLNLSGVFHLPVLMGNVNTGHPDSVRSSFLTGVLATAVATPCTAPFMAPAIGVALTLSAAEAMTVFLSLGFGLALPFLLVSFFPSLLKFLPKPGAWMERFKEFLALPMYASVVWLLWVLTLQTGASGMVVITSGMVAIIAVLWCKPFFEQGSLRYQLFVVATLAGILAISLPMLANLSPASSISETKSEIKTIPYSKAALAELRTAGTPVYLDATAAWCITCQVNARVALHTEATEQVFKDYGVVLMVADWTRRDDAITELLASFGFQGVPMNVFYPAHGEPVVLPQILTEDSVISTIKGETQ